MVADPDLRIGVLALQGNVSEHVRAFDLALTAKIGEHQPVIQVRRPAEIEGLDALALPGGESTTISRLIEKNGLYRPLVDFPGGLFATCAGMVLLATSVDDPRVNPLGLIEMRVERNAFGRQFESFEADIRINGLDSPFHAVFIRAPIAAQVGADAEILARINDGAVAVRQSRHLALSFHPELGADLRLHTLFLEQL
ncbi:Pyridoxal 5'-phosphate synthase subunit PdxT [anaerobic digester metagenome]